MHYAGFYFDSLKIVETNHIWENISIRNKLFPPFRASL